MNTPSLPGSSPDNQHREAPLGTSTGRRIPDEWVAKPKSNPATLDSLAAVNGIDHLLDLAEANISVIESKLNEIKLNIQISRNISSALKINYGHLDSKEH